MAGFCASKKRRVIFRVLRGKKRFRMQNQYILNVKKKKTIKGLKFCSDQFRIYAKKKFRHGGVTKKSLFLFGVTKKSLFLFLYDPAHAK